MNADLQSNFSTETGLLQYKALSRHKPMAMDDDKLIAASRERMKSVLESTASTPSYMLKPIVYTAKKA